MTGTGADWWVVDGVATAWFALPSLTASATLAAQVLEVPGALVDVRPTGVRVRLDAPDRTRTAAVSALARDLGARTDPGALQHLGLVVESADPDRVREFWQVALGYDAPDGAELTDPSRRDPAVRLRRSAEPRPLRQRVHLDVVRPAGVVAATGMGAGDGPYGVRHADADGNEIDLVPGDPLGTDPATADWQTVFGAVACYAVTSPEQQRGLVVAAARTAEDVGFPLLVDARPGLVVLDSGKDRWEADAHGLDVDFVDLAARLQAAARNLGAAADPRRTRFVQVFLDAADVPAVRAFWAAALGYDEDRRPWVTDIADPRRLGPVLAFQDLDPADVERRRQRNRTHVELAVPAAVAAERVAAAVAAGGRVLDGTVGCRRVADPEGNELVVVATP